MCDINIHSTKPNQLLIPGALSSKIVSQDVKLTTHLHLAAICSMCGALFRSQHARIYLHMELNGVLKISVLLTFSVFFYMKTKLI